MHDKNTFAKHCEYFFRPLLEFNREPDFDKCVKCTFLLYYTLFHGFHMQINGILVFGIISSGNVYRIHTGIKEVLFNNTRKPVEFEAFIILRVIWLCCFTLRESVDIECCG